MRLGGNIADKQVVKIDLSAKNTLQIKFLSVYKKGRRKSNFVVSSAGVTSCHLGRAELIQIPDLSKDDFGSSLDFKVAQFLFDFLKRAKTCSPCQALCQKVLAGLQPS